MSGHPCRSANAPSGLSTLSPIPTARCRFQLAERRTASGSVFVLASRGADIVEYAVRAVCPAGLARSASVEDQEVGEDGPVFFWYYLHEVLLDLHGILTLGEAEPARDTADVGVHNDALVRAESVAEDHVGRLAADAGQGYELGHRAGDLSRVLLYEGAGHAPQGAGLVAVEAGRADALFELVGGRISVVLSRTVLREQALGHPVDLHVCGLGGEDGRYQEFQGVGPVELGARVRVRGLQTGCYFWGGCCGWVHDGRGLYPVLNYLRKKDREREEPGHGRGHLRLPEPR